MLATLAERRPEGGALAVRAQARRRPGPGLRQRRQHPALLPQPEAARRRLSRAGGCALASPCGATRCSTARSWPWTRRPGRAASPGSSAGCSSATRPAPARSGVPVELYLFDCMFYEGIDLTEPAAGGPEGGAARRRLVRRPDPVHAVPHHRLGRDVPRGVRQGRRGDHRQAGGEPLCERAVHRLAQDQVRAPAGARGRRLHRAQGLAREPGRAAGGLLRARRAHATRARSAPATTARRSSCCSGSWRRCTGARRRSRRGPRPPARCSG